MKRILIYNSGGGLGDSIQLIPLIISLKSHFKKSQLYYLGAHENHFKGKLKEYNINLENLDLNLNYFGFRWWHYLIVKKQFLKKALGKFDLIIDLQSKIRNTLIVFSFISLILGLANPKIGTKVEEVKIEGIDLFIAFDVSKSMLAEDISPNRIEKAKITLLKLIDKLRGDRIGVVIFAGESFLEMPLTTDYSAAKIFISNLNTEMVEVQGTEIGSAIDLCVKSFDFDNNHDKAIIIVTDGENHDQNAIERSKEANKKNVKILTIGVGETEPTLIPIGNKKYLQHNKKSVTTKLNEDLLKEIAKVTSGIYIREDNSNFAITKLLDKIKQMEQKEISSQKITEYEDRFQWFFTAGLVFLLISLVITSNIKKTSSNK